ncbi:MAG: hypothetical protein A2X36_10775 [Elusimicrobia bacterium GWA2_69_24]|nr:MAG: hypothetical protein A2X36_10775 [Elusimicrobia bacterium GWA2_69_24]HBL18484.1 hypothetical protein [Elusimicrobiota bacterium]
MDIVMHRVNRIRDLRGLDPRLGLEFDVRSRGGGLILNHQAHEGGDALEPYLAAVADSGRDRLLVFNPKEDGLEDGILELVRRAGLTRFFILDLPMPTIIKLAVRRGLPDLAVRVSEYEPAGAALLLQGKVRWAWVDCFSGEPPAEEVLRELKRGFKTCLVSPELQGYPRERIERFRALAPLLDAVCTDHPDLWRP